MRNTLRILGLIVLVAGVGWLGWTPVRGMYLSERAELDQSILRLRDEVDRYKAGSDDHVAVTDALRAHVDRTLGGDLESVDHELRTRLNRLGEEIGLESLSVATGRVRRMESPARNDRAFRRHPDLREEIDFVEVEASISGQGSLDEVLQLVHRIESQPFLKRVVQVRLQPRDNGERFVVTVRLVTLFLPDRFPAHVPETGSSPGGLEWLGPLVSRNPFRLPPKTVEPAPAATPPPAPDTPDPLGTWTLTGVVSGPEGVEAWLLEATSGRSRRMLVGQTIEELRLVAAGGETAEFQLGDERFRVHVGRRLSERDPAGSRTVPESENDPRPGGV